LLVCAQLFVIDDFVDTFNTLHIVTAVTTLDATCKNVMPWAFGLNIKMYITHVESSQKFNLVLEIHLCGVSIMYFYKYH